MGVEESERKVADSGQQTKQKNDPKWWINEELGLEYTVSLFLHQFCTGSSEDACHCHWILCLPASTNDTHSTPVTHVHRAWHNIAQLTM